MAASSSHQEGPLTAKIPALSSVDNKEHRVLIVDVGGGRGQVLNALRKARPDLKGLMIVQDLPKEIDGRQSCQEVHGMVHDFFTTLPVQGTSVRRDPPLLSSPKTVVAAQKRSQVLILISFGIYCTTGLTNPVAKFCCRRFLP